MRHVRIALCNKIRVFDGNGGLGGGVVVVMNGNGIDFSGVACQGIQLGVFVQ